MLNLTDMQTIRALANRHHFSFSKGLGQNFLIDPAVCPAIAAYGIPDADHAALEVGPGFGVLTQQLALQAKRVVSVEIDRRLEPVLAETLQDLPNTSILWGDVLKLDLKHLFAEQFGDMPVAFCANLPYYITSPILMYLLESDVQFASMTVMVQKEAAERLCAEVGSRAAGAVTVAVQLRGKAEYLLDVPRESFYPSPNVDSAVIRITPHSTPLCSAEEFAPLLKMVKAGFAQRRKTAMNALSSGLNCPKAILAAAFAECALAENVRFEQLDMQTLLALSRAITARL